MIFSIIVVCLNAGEKLHKTIESILCQTENDYEIVVKDGGSSDGSTDLLAADSRIALWSEPDQGIYDAMNQALRHVRGTYVCFLNCGDYFHDEEVLRRVKEQIAQIQENRPAILYGNILERRTGALVQSNPVLDDFACYRNLPCHQACFYDRQLFESRSFDIRYRVRADYEHFLWCLYRTHAAAIYMPLTVASYEGGGYSESAAGRRLSAKEHREIAVRYFSARKVRRYRMTMLLTLAPLRTWIAGNPATAGAYQRMKKMLYQSRKHAAQERTQTDEKR